jgi:(1->4)-alpha-D-glucan 1-alpha-D-glucosylmutase
MEVRDPVAELSWQPRIPLSTYRVQLHRGFDFDAAGALVDYLDALGITDLYASPILRAVPGSMHGYDIVDHAAVNPDLGGRAALERLSDRLAARGMGLLLDTVPNHMCTSGINAWWMDVLENGPSSLHASYFDIDWRPLKAELENKVLLPVLGDHYGRVLERGELRLRYGGGGFFIDYWERSFPLNPRTYALILEPLLPGLVEKLGETADAVLELQSILTGLAHLPARTETKRAKVIERNREKEILKRRLATLVADNAVVAEAAAAQVQHMNGQPGDPKSFDALHVLLEAQAYRLSYFGVAAEAINYRRFFDINDLAAIRMENPAVFEETHALLLELCAAGRVAGLRIDHPDGLWDPGAYLSNLQRGYFLERCRRALLAAGDPGEAEREAREAFDRAKPQLLSRFLEMRDAAGLVRPLYIVVEKILSRGEELPRDWPVHGTVGYEFAALCTGLFVDRAAERALTDLYARVANARPRFEDVAYEKKRLILQGSMASELNVLAHALAVLAERNRYSRDFTLGTLAYALREVIAWFPVYRTYVSDRSEGISPRDRAVVAQAIRLARRRSPITDPSVYRFLERILTLDFLPEATPEQKRMERDFVMKLQQLTGPVMAKGLEDTAFYVYQRLVSLNEVGGEPERFGVTTAAFHQANAERARRWPASLSATSTHDSKRSEDVRARISVLSEVPELWESALERIRAASAAHKTELDGEPAPDANEEYLLYQTLLGTFPFASPQAMEPAALDEYTQRIVAYMTKAMKEAKVNTSWINPNPEYEEAMERFIRAALRPGSLFLEAFAPIARTVAYHGMWSALGQVLLKLGSPGVPDVYQGNEIWELSLVDPDNRRPVDWSARRRALAELVARRTEGEHARFARELVARAEDGQIKLFTTWVGLHARKSHAALFREGAYHPLAARGARAEHAVAFARALGAAPGGEEEVVAIAPRLTARLAGGSREPPLGAIWADTAIPVTGRRYRNLYTGRRTVAVEGALPLAQVLADFPVALLEKEA